MSIQWDRDFPEWSSGLRPAHFDKGEQKEFYRRNMKDSPWVKREVEGVSYYGKTLEGKYGEQIITGGKIILTGLTFCTLLPIPLLIYVGAHEKIVLWVLQLHTNAKLKYKITHQPVTSPPNASPSLDVNANKDVLGLLFKSATNLNPEEAKNYFGTLFAVAKDVVKDKEALRIDLINKGKLKIHEIPELNGKKKKILNYICTHGQKLTYLELSPKHDWNDEDLEKIVQACPNLKTFIHDALHPVTLKGTGEILKLTQLESLQLKSYQPASFDALKNLKELTLEHTQSPSLDNLTQLEKLTLVNIKIPSLDKLVNLKELTISTNYKNIVVPNLDQLVGLEKLKLELFRQDIPSLDALVNLVDLSIESTGHQIPSSLEKQEKLRCLHIKNPWVREIKIASNASLEVLILQCIGLKEPLKIDKPETVHTLFLKGGSPPKPDYLKQFSNLRRLSSRTFSTDIMSHLPLLEELSVSQPSQLDSLTPQQKGQLKKLEIDGDMPASLDDFVNLEELSIRGSMNVPSISLEKLTKLKKLKIYHTPHLQRLEHLDKLTKLTHLNLEGCPELKIQKASVNALEDLTELRIIDCVKILGKKKLITERNVHLQKAVIWHQDLDI